MHTAVHPLVSSTDSHSVTVNMALARLNTAVACAETGEIICDTSVDEPIVSSKSSASCQQRSMSSGIKVILSSLGSTNHNTCFSRPVVRLILEAKQSLAKQLAHMPLPWLVKGLQCTLHRTFSLCGITRTMIRSLPRAVSSTMLHCVFSGVG